MPTIFAADLGGTNAKAATVTVLGEGEGATLLLGDVRTEPSGDTFDDAIAALAALRGQTGGAVDGWALAVPGLVDGAGRVVALPGKLAGIVGADLAGRLTQSIGVEAGVRPPVIVNDAIAFGVGEAVAGAGAGHGRVAVVTIGTGVGVAIVEDGEPVGEPPLGGGILGGQLPILDPVGPVDTNGKSGTFEARCRAYRIVGETADAGGAFSSIPEVYDAYGRGEPAAVEGVSSYRRCLARGIVAVVHAHVPDVVVVGGGPAFSGAPIFDGLEDVVRADLWPGMPDVPVVPAGLGPAAPLAGLAHLWQQRR